MRTPNPRGRGEELREQLVTAASHLLLSPQAMTIPSLRSVARACDVSPAAVYLHFASQESLMQSVVEAQLNSLAAAISARDDDAIAPEVSFARAYAVWGLANPGAYQLLFESADRLPQSEHAAANGGMAMVEEAATLLARTHSPGEAFPLAMILWTALHGIVSLRLHKPHLDWGDLDAQISDMIGRLLR